MKKLATLAVACLALAWWPLALEAAQVALPYDRTNPVIYDNDAVVDAYGDEHVLALASAGSIDLRGVITSASVSPYNQYITPAAYDQFVIDRQTVVTKARNSGFKTLPNPVVGCKGNLVKPASGRISDTVPFGSAGSWLIVTEARKATAQKPLVVCMGGMLTAAADAYLLDNSIADKIVVAYVGGNVQNLSMEDYNSWGDGWAAYIVLTQLRIVMFADYNGLAYVPKDRLWELPDKELRQWMIDHWPGDFYPGFTGAGDEPPMISLMRADYAKQARRVSFSYFNSNFSIEGNSHEVPMCKDDPNGRAMLVTMMDGAVATDEWWRALKNPAAWGTIATVPVTLEAENMSTKTPNSSPMPGGWNLWGTGDYVEESVSFPALGTYRFDIVAAGPYGEGAWPLLELRIDQVRVAQISVDSTTWKTFTLTATVSAGIHRVAIAFMNDSASRDLYVDKVTITASGGGGGGGGGGLKGEYFDNMDFTTLRVTRTDATVDFDWGSGSPDPSMGADTFSVRWTGTVRAATSETYTFYTVSDDGVRLWVNGQLLINNWTNHAATENAGAIALTAGQSYDIKMEFYENGGLATARLLWSSASTPKQVIPSGQLTPAGTTPPSGLVGYWKLDDAGGSVAGDSSGAGNTGTLVNGPTWTTGHQGGALRFNGSNYVRVDDNPSLSITGPVTVAAWYLYQGDGTGAWGRIACKAWNSATSPWVAYSLQLDGGTPGVSQRAGFGTGLSSSQGSWVTSSTTLVIGQWYHLAGVYDPALGRISIYVNGVKEAEAATGNSQIADTAGAFEIGNDAATNQSVIGVIDEVRVYNRALSAGEIQALAVP